MNMTTKKQPNYLFKLFYIGLLLLFVYLAIQFYYGFYKNTKELFTLNPSIFPNNNPTLATQYPYSGRKNVSNDNYNQIWWKYPIFKEGSYKQITNNIRYSRNPDEGTCISADFCGALYKNKKTPTNYHCILPPVPNGEGARVNYYRALPNLLI